MIFRCFRVLDVLKPTYVFTPYYLINYRKPFDDYMLCSPLELKIWRGSASIASSDNFSKTYVNLALSRGFFHWRNFNVIPLVLPYRDMCLFFLDGEVFVCDYELNRVLSRSSQPDKLMASLILQLKEFDFGRYS